MILRRFSISIILSLLVLSCSEKENMENKVIRIGFSATPEIFLQERWDRDIKIFNSKARELGAEVIIAKTPGGSKDQVAQIQFLLTQEIDVLVIIPKDKEMLSGIVRRTLDRGIPVLSYDRPIMGVPITGYISFDNQEVGRLMANALIDHVPEGKYLIVNGSIMDNNSFEVSKGLHEIIDPLVLEERIEIVDEIWLEEWSYDEALEKISTLMETDLHIDAISAANDDLAQAAIRVLAEKQLAGEIAVVGQDADLLSCQSIIEGTQLMTVYKPIQKLAARAAEISVKMARDEVLIADGFIDNQSGEEIPFFIEQPIPVFKDDMDDTVIRDGFHSREDVYRKSIGQN